AGAGCGNRRRAGRPALEHPSECPAPSRGPRAPSPFEIHIVLSLRDNGPALELLLISVEALFTASPYRARASRGQPISVHRFAAFWIGQWPVPPRLSQSVFIEALGHVNQGFQSESNGACLVVLPVFFANERPRDIQMGPCGISGNELLQEQPCRQRACDRPPDVVEVRVGSFQELFVFFRKRQLPKSLALVLTGLNHSLDQTLVIAHHACDAESKCPDTSTRQ